MIFSRRRKEKTAQGEEAVQRAEQERKKSQERLEESQSVLHTLMQLHKENHIAPMIHALIERRTEGR